MPSGLRRARADTTSHPRAAGCRIIGVEIDAAAAPVQAHPFRGNTAFMLGNEARAAARPLQLRLHAPLPHRARARGRGASPPQGTPHPTPTPLHPTPLYPPPPAAPSRRARA